MADDGIFSSLTRGAKFKGNSVLKATRKRALGNSGARNKKIDFGQLDFFGSNQPPTSVEASTTKKNTVSKPPRKEHVTAQGLDENSNADQPATKKRTRRSKKRKGNKLVENDTDSSNIQLFSASVKAKQAQVAKPADPAEKNAREAHAQEISTFRNRIGIKVNGNGAMADPISTFGEMEKMEALQDKTTIVHVLLRNIELSKYEEPTPIQMQSIPTMLQGRDVVARAPTGSGKTAAFLIPLIIRLNVPMRKGGIRALVVAPTRELAVQILREFSRLTDGKKFKASVLRKSTAASIAQQASASNSGESSSGDLLVATPLRLVNMIKSKQIGLDNVETVVFDEADKLFEMGFLEQVDEIIAALNVSRKTGDVPALKAMFSATMPPQVETLARSVMLDPVTITCGANLAGANTIQQELLFVGQEEGKILAFRQLLQQGKLKPPVMVFVQSKERAKALHEELLFDGIRVDAVHAERSETKRDALVKRFRTGETWFLIATDLMGRGIDFKNVNCVVNYDFPTSAISYVHRIGRTGRAGRKGTAITFFTNADMEYLRSIANVMKISGCPVPEWMLHLKKQKSKDKRALEKKPPTRSTIDTMVTKYDKLKQDKKRNMIAMSKKRKLEQSKKSS